MKIISVGLACVKLLASVHSEPGSNSLTLFLYWIVNNFNQLIKAATIIIVFLIILFNNKIIKLYPFIKLINSTATVPRTR